MGKDVFMQQKSPFKSCKRGRPLKYTPELQQQFCQYIAEGFDFNEVCKTVGIHRVTGWCWLNKYPRFSEAINKAIKKCESERLKRLVKELTEYRKKHEAGIFRNRKFKTDRNYPIRKRDEKGQFI